MEKKQLLSSEDLVEHMARRGIRFEYISKIDALSFLISNNNYFKLSSYRKNFPKYTEGEYKGKYIDLDFGHLVDMSTIDMHLRHLLLKMTLDIEHYIKVDLLRNIETNESEDGYKIVQDYIKQNNIDGYNKIVQDIKKNIGNPYCGELLSKYGVYKDEVMIKDFPIWAFIEVISFGVLRSFCKFYYDKYKIKDDDINFLLTTVNQLRNAVAHSNCIINNLYPIHPGSVNFYKPNYKVMKLLSKAQIAKSMRENKMKNPRLRQIVTMLYVFDKVITSKAIKETRYAELVELINVRMKKHKNYYKKNPTIVSAFQFIEKLSIYLSSSL